ncbi:hypothetical protein PSPO01_11738 [Paraphaeosphaeria sporulosa]
MKRFIREVPPSSEGLLILLDLGKNQETFFDRPGRSFGRDEQLLQTATMIGVAEASRYLRFYTRLLKGEMEDWNNKVEGLNCVVDALQRLSHVRGEIHLSEPDIQGAYLLFTNEATLLEARRSIQMAEKSIEMSETSIKESERVRILTIIAMIFLPVSLASSIFGMNVKNISSDTTPFYAFFVTAIALFIGALIIWAGSSITVRYNKVHYAKVKALDDSKNNGKWWSDTRNALLIHLPWHLRLRAAMTSWWLQEDAMRTLFSIEGRFHR